MLNLIKIVFLLMGTILGNALDIYHFFEKIKENISDTNEKLFSNFNIALNDNKDFYNKFKNYTIAYKEIMYLHYYNLEGESYTNLKLINDILINSEIKIFINDKMEYTFDISVKSMFFDKENI